MPRKAAPKRRNPLSRDNISRATLGREVQRRIRQFGLSRAAAAKLVDDADSQISRLMTGHLNEFSADRLVGMLLKLGCDVDILIRHGKALGKGGKVKIVARGGSR